MLLLKCSKIKKIGSKIKKIAMIITLDVPINWFTSCSFLQSGKYRPTPSITQFKETAQKKPPVNIVKEYVPYSSGVINLVKTDIVATEIIAGIILKIK